MKPITFCIFFILCLSSSAVDFNRDIKPVLSRKCFSCHNKDKQKGKLQLDERDAALKSLVGKNGETPEILKRIFHNDPDEIMPPPDKGTLTNSEKNLIKQWVSEGAKYDKHWAFIAPKKVSPPDLKDKWFSNDIDKFILKKLKKDKIEPNKVVFDHRLFRRLSLITTGLPPDDEDFIKFTNGELHYEAYLEQLLEKSSFGEHWATWWLDGARYGDTNGIEYDNSRPIWPYRDWVIKALNENMPYDQFLTEQIAGDLIPHSTLSQQVATGFLRCNVSTNEQGSIEEEFKAFIAKDRLNTTMSVTTGLTVSCAECHDHKYDPISQKEYYQLLAFFNNIDGMVVGQPFDRSDPPLVPLVSENDYKQILNWEKAIKHSNMVIEQARKQAKDDFWWWHYKQQTQPNKTIYLISKLDNYFPLDETEGTFTYNIITEHKCNIKGLMTRLNGKYGKAQGFRGSSFIDCLNVAKYDINSKFSIGCWLLPETGNVGTVAAKFNSQLSKGWKIRISNNKISFHLNSSKDQSIKIITHNPIPQGKWSHINITYNGSGKASGLKLFINGNEVKVTVESDNLNESFLVENNLKIGSESIEDNLLYTLVDEFYTAGFELSKEQIQLISQFDADYRYALLPPNSIPQNYKAKLFEYFLKYVYQKSSAVYRDKSKMEEEIGAILKNSVTTMVMKEKENQEPTFILDGGKYDSPLKEVQRSTPAFLPEFESKLPKNRLGLAMWLTNPRHPLTARFIVNRIWQNIFGRGLVKTVSDFGIQGDFPTHPELLDYLANDFIENDWNIKQLIKKILNSSTFKQSSDSSKLKSKHDPENDLYSSFSRRRMTAEMIRDQALKLSNKFNSDLFGKPVFPYQPPSLWSEVTADVSNTKHYKQSKGKDNYRRSIYTFWKRNFPPPAMSIFDAPSRQTCTLSRKTSNTPNQALVLLNDKQFTELYKEIANSTKQHNLSPKDKIHEIYLKILFRKPSEEELTLCLDFFSRNQTLHSLVKVLMNLDETISIE